MSWFIDIFRSIRMYYRFRKQLKSLRKQEPYIYK